MGDNGKIWEKLSPAFPMRPSPCPPVGHASTATSSCPRILQAECNSTCTQDLFKVAIVTSVTLALNLPKGKNPVPSTRALRLAQDDKKEL